MLVIKDQKKHWNKTMLYLCQERKPEGNKSQGRIIILYLFFLFLFKKKIFFFSLCKVHSILMKKILLSIWVFFFPQNGGFFIKNSLSNAFNLFIFLLGFLIPFFLCTHSSPLCIPRTGLVDSGTIDTLGWISLCCRELSYAL